jgi:TonB family protein
MKIRNGFANIVAVTVLSVASLSGQGVILTNPAWINTTAAVGDQPPEFKNKIVPTDAVGKSDQLGYTYTAVVLDAEGHSTRASHFASYPYFENVVHSWFPKLEFRPALKAAKPVPSFAWFALIFNPSSSNRTLPDATPQLLTVAPAIVSAELLGKSNWIEQVWTTLTIDASGNPQKIVFDQREMEKFRAPVEQTVKSWKFAPALCAGQPTVAEVHLPVFMQLATAYVVPKVIFQPAPIYPRALKEKKINGAVLVVFEVTEKGRVSNPVVQQSSNPDFNKAAIAAVKRWEFEPATLNFRPVATKVAETIFFLPPGGPTAPRTTTDVPPKQISPEARAVVLPVYPYELLRDNVAGAAHVRYQVNTLGHVDGNDVLSASRPEFGFALTAAVEATEFVPMNIHGRPVVGLFKLERKFVPGGADGVPREIDLGMLAREKNQPETIVSAKNLDAPLRLIAQQTPIFPFSVAGRLENGEALVEFIIDEDGRVTLPRTVQANDPAFGYAAAQAAVAWRFEPPRAGGNPAAVRARVPFKFKREATPLAVATGESKEVAK